MSAASRPVSILIAALGGQGGGVLTEWIVDAATQAGLRAQATSIPGVAQRTGATTYYLEIYPEPLPAGSPAPVFSLYPMPGDVDVIVASELLAAIREGGVAVERNLAGFKAGMEVAAGAAAPESAPARSWAETKLERAEALG